MSYLLDTNVVSELRKPEHRADPHVLEWAARQTPSALHLSAMTIMEIEVGILRLERRDERQAARYEHWLNAQVIPQFSGRILPVDLRVAKTAARLHVPDPRPERDALIGATASVHGLTVVTRNISDFAGFGVTVVNPWDVSPEA